MNFNYLFNRARRKRDLGMDDYFFYPRAFRHLLNQNGVLNGMPTKTSLEVRSPLLLRHLGKTLRHVEVRPHNRNNLTRQR